MPREPDIRDTRDEFEVSQKDINRANEAAAGLNILSQDALNEAETNLVRLEEATKRQGTKIKNFEESARSQQRINEKYKEDVRAINAEVNIPYLVRDVGAAVANNVGKLVQVTKKKNAQKALEKFNLAKQKAQRDMAGMTEEERLKAMSDPNSSYNQAYKNLEEELTKSLGKGDARAVINRARVSKAEELNKIVEETLAAEEKEKVKRINDKLNAHSNAVGMWGPDSKQAEKSMAEMKAVMEVELADSNLTPGKREKIESGLNEAIRRAEVNESVAFYMYKGQGEMVRTTLSRPENQSVISASTRRTGMNFLKRWDSPEGVDRRTGLAMQALTNRGNTAPLRAMMSTMDSAGQSATMKFIEEFDRATKKNYGKFDETGLDNSISQLDPLKHASLIKHLVDGKEKLKMAYREDGVAAHLRYTGEVLTSEENFEKFGKFVTNQVAAGIVQECKIGAGADISAGNQCVMQKMLENKIPIGAMGGRNGVGITIKQGVATIRQHVKDDDKNGIQTLDTIWASTDDDAGSAGIQNMAMTQLQNGKTVSNTLKNYISQDEVLRDFLAKDGKTQDSKHTTLRLAVDNYMQSKEGQEAIIAKAEELGGGEDKTKQSAAKRIVARQKYDELGRMWATQNPSTQLNIIAPNDNGIGGSMVQPSNAEVEAEGGVDAVADKYTTFVNDIKDTDTFLEKYGHYLYPTSRQALKDGAKIVVDTDSAGNRIFFHQMPGERPERMMLYRNLSRADQYNVGADKRQLERKRALVSLAKETFGQGTAVYEKRKREFLEQEATAEHDFAGGLGDQLSISFHDIVENNGRAVPHTGFSKKVASKGAARKQIMEELEDQRKRLEDQYIESPGGRRLRTSQGRVNKIKDRIRTLTAALERLK